MENKFKTLKVITILGTRPEIIRLSRIIPKLDMYFQHKIVYTNQNYDYELSEIFFKELGIRKADFILNTKAETLGSQIGNIIAKTEEVLKKENPDAIFILGDTNSSLSAIIAKRMHIPIFHMEAGNRSFDWNVPEEINRRIVDHISDFNLCYTEHSRRNLLHEGLESKNTFVVGSPLAEVFSYYGKQIKSSKVLRDLHLRKKNYFLVSAHREENVDNQKKLTSLFNTLNSIAKTYNKPVIVSMHPRTRKRFEKLSITLDKRINISKPFGFYDYNMLQYNAFCVLSDSGSIQEEASINQFPAIQIRVSNERPEAFDTGSIILIGLDASAVISAIEMTTQEFKSNKKIAIPFDYQSINISEKVIKLILGLISIKKNYD